MAASVAHVVRLAPLAAFCAIAIGLGFALRTDPRRLPSMLIDRPVPSFQLSALTPTDPGFSSAELKGRVMLLNVFASWCPGCRIEHPTLLRLSREGSFPLYGINWKDKPSDGLKWLASHKNPYLKVGADPSGRVGIDLGVTAIPETFVIDAEGRVRLRYAGPVTEDVWRVNFEPLLAALRSSK